MKRTTIATVLLLCFMVSFSFSGVVAACTAEDTTVSTYVSHYYTLYSLSSAPVMLLPLIILLALVALVSYVQKQPNVGFLFTVVMVVLYIVFLATYSAENRNNSVYNILNEQFEELGIRVRKRDFNIVMTPNWVCYLTAALGVLTAAVSFPNFKTKLTRYHLKAELEPYIYIAPQVVLFVTFSLVPIVYAVYAAFTQWDLYNDPVFTGLNNFRTILFE